MNEGNEETSIRKKVNSYITVRISQAAWLPSSFVCLCAWWEGGRTKERVYYETERKEIYYEA